MRLVLAVAAFGVAGFGQTLGEVGAATAGATVGGASGKKVSEGVTSIFEKLDKSTTAAASTGTPAKPAPNSPPLINAAPGLPVAGGALDDPAAPKKPAAKPVARAAAVKDSVPAPPPLPGEFAAERKVTPAFRAPEPIAVVALPPPPPPPVTAADLKTVAVGWTKEEVLKLGQPSSRITMWDDGHLQERFRYSLDEATGVVQLVDGVVSAIEIR